MPGDPESEFLRDEHNKFHKLVFVSNWQMQAYINYYNLPWSKCTVVPNAIEPIEMNTNKSKDTIRLGYWSTPHRGLNILVPVFEKLCEKYDNIELDVYSSFSLYGWEERDEAYKPLFDQCENHPKINYHGAVPKDQISESLKDMHILAYPSTWPETSCVVLIEAMAAGLLCVHPNYGALYETASNWTWMYQWDEDLHGPANLFYKALDNAIAVINGEEQVEDLKSHFASQSGYINLNYSWNRRIPNWNSLLQSLLDEDRALPGPSFNYKVN